VSSLGYGLGSWGLLNVVFVLSMLYSGRRTAARRLCGHPRAARQGTFDRDARTGQEPRANQRLEALADRGDGIDRRLGAYRSRVRGSG
jgi:hypothetical protein